MFVLPRGWLERVVLIVLVLGLVTFLVTGCAAVEMAQEGGGSGNPWGLPWWAWLLIGIAGTAILL